jgi:hypothetical protein
MSEARQRQTGQTPAWLLFSGVVIGVIGASVNKHAESVGERVVALSGRTENSDATAAVALGQWSLLLVVAGAVVVLAGLVVLALIGRRRCYQLAPGGGEVGRIAAGWGERCRSSGWRSREDSAASRSRTS